MAWNGTGTYNLPAAYTPEVNGTVVDATRYNGATSDIATGITAALAKNGENSATANLRMGGFKLTGMGAATAAGDAVRFEQANLLVSDATITLAATTSDIGASASGTILLNGTGVTVTAFPAAPVGTVKIVRFNGINTLVDSASFDHPGPGNITTAAGDSAVYQYITSGWRCVMYSPASGGSLVASFPDGTVSLPGASFTNDTDTGFYRIGANNLGSAIGGAKWLDAGSTSVVISRGTVVTTGDAFSIVTNASASPGTATISIATAGTSGSTTSSATFKTGSDTTGLTGDVNIQTGNGYTSAGTINLTAGNTVIAGSGANTAGAVNIAGGSVASTANGNGGSVTLSAGKGNGGTSDGAIVFKVWTDNVQYPIAQVRNRERVWAWDTAGGGPTIFSGGGTGAVIAGSSYGCNVTIGTGAGTTMQVTLTSGSIGQRPSVGAVMVQSSNPAYTCTVAMTGAPNRVQVTFSSAPTSGDIISLMASYYV